MDKPALRAAARDRRDAFAAASPPAIPVHPAFLAALRPDMIVASYAPVGSEADPALLAGAASELGCRIALPHVVDRETPLRFLLWEGDAPLAAGPFGLSIPHPHWTEVAPDVILTPLLAFDDALNRLGQGAGHYDRAFAALPAAWRVGVAWSAQRVAALPTDPWDLTLHAVATETTWLTR